jgi:lipopolysaccharide/colanic/teichoic acid biosynthesis glycosyltransferase
MVTVGREKEARLGHGLTKRQQRTKRLVDMGLVIPITLFALPLMALVAIVIKFATPGPILYRQERVGENGRRFKMLKFRSMINGAEQELKKICEQTTEDQEVLFKRPADPRVTRIGRVLRRTSLDELPQLFNVLLGDMSLVGPRPELPCLVDRYELWQYERLTVPQGITGWWQINGRADKPMHLHTEEDIFYVRHYSLRLDLIILLKTPWIVLRGHGAY